MFDLWKMTKITEKLELLLKERPEIFKEDLTVYLESFNFFDKQIELFIEVNQEVCEAACDFCETVSKMPENNIFEKIYKKIEMKKAYYYINKYDNKLKKAYDLQKRWEKINQRLTQFKYFS